MRCRIGIVHLEELGLRDLFSRGVLERISDEPLGRDPTSRSQALCYRPVTTMSPDGGSTVSTVEVSIEPVKREEGDADAYRVEYADFRGPDGDSAHDAGEGH